tara:strand:+ start:3252 stop:4931 length:1680 start_codon:yes stop_codon:yes gene_type:complete
MPGGLIQIVAYGSQDLFLTSIPEVTFFKFIYNRYTNFSMEFKELKFSGNKNFGEKVFCTIPKDGDLLNELFVKFQLPNVNIAKTLDNAKSRSNILDILNNFEDEYSKYKIFISHIFNCINIGNQGLTNINETFNNINNNINYYLNENKDYILSMSNVNIDVQNRFNIKRDLNKIKDLNINEMEKKDKLRQLIKSYLYSNKNISKKYSDIINDNNNELKKIDNNSYSFAWNKHIGYNIINNADIEIGGNIIDKQYSLWLYFWNEIFETKIRKLNLKKLYSLNSKGYNFDNNPKSSFYIYVPLIFFFSRNIGLSLPLISVRTQLINLSVKIENLNKLIYTDYPYSLENNIKLKNVSLIAKYIYLDQDEREKFADSSHEYLIEQVHLFNYNTLKSNELNIDLNINHPIKYLIWIIQNDKNDKYNLFNYFGSKISYDLDSFIFPDKIKSVNNPINTFKLTFNGMDRIRNLDGNYFNYLTSYESKLSTPEDGINFYSFSLDPKNIQPSGSCNFSKIDSKKISIELNKSFLEQLNDDDYIYFRMIYVNYNVLRFSNGLGSLIFNF